MRKKKQLFAGIMAAAMTISVIGTNVYADEILEGSGEDNLYTDMEGETAPQQPQSSGTDTAEDDWLFADGEDGVMIREGERYEDVIAAEQEAAKEQETEAEEIETETEELMLWLPLERAEQDRIQEHLDKLAQWENPTGSDGELYCAEYIEEFMEECGYTISEQSFHEGFLNEDGVDAPGINIMAERGANSEDRSRDIFIVSTHYDSKTKPEDGDPFANDKSGVAVLMETARILANEQSDIDLCFLFLSGEEDGLYGTQRFIQSVKEEHMERISGYLYVELVGYDTEQPYVLKTIDGVGNTISSRVENVARGISPKIMLLAEMEQIEQNMEDLEGEEQQEIENEAETEEKWQENDWKCVPDDKTSQALFAELEIPAVTVSQDLRESGSPEEKMTEIETEDEREETKLDSEQLTEFTDIFAQAVGQLMTINTYGW